MPEGMQASPVSKAQAVVRFNAKLDRNGPGSDWGILIGELRRAVLAAAKEGSAQIVRAVYDRSNWTLVAVTLLSIQPQGSLWRVLFELRRGASSAGPEGHCKTDFQPMGHHRRALLMLGQGDAAVPHIRALAGLSTWQ